VAAVLAETEPQRRVEFVIQAGMTATGDARLLRIVLENLMGNAWKFTRREPQTRIEIGTTEEAGKTVHYVRDNGVGFDMTYADKLFGAFQRLHAMNEFEGTGIGLATVQRIITRHGGRIWANSAVNEGAMFYFTLD
jgi:light-regulated signal transduction histidine kinase (bacteriophytochrome)